MDESLIRKFARNALEQNAEVLLLEESGLAATLLEISRGAAATTFCVSEDLREAVADPLKSAGLREVEISADIAMTGSSWAVAETGSVVVEGSRRQFITAGVHVVVVDPSKLVHELGGLPLSEAVQPPFTFVTGPSRTSDIERTLVLGAHGPRRLVVLIIRP